MLVAQHPIQMATPALVELAEAAVAVTVRVGLTILLPQQLQRQMAVGLQFLVKVRKVRRGPAGFVAAQGMPEQRLFQPGLVPAIGQRPTHPCPPRALQAISNAPLRDQTTASDLILAQAQLEPEPQHFSVFAHGQFFGRQCGFLLVPEEPQLPDSCPASLALTLSPPGEPYGPSLRPAENRADRDWKGHHHAPESAGAERAEKAAVIMTTNLPFSEWTQVIPNARLCKALLDRITDRAHILETGTESYRSRRTAEKRNRPAKTAESKSS